MRFTGSLKRSSLFKALTALSLLLFTTLPLAINTPANAVSPSAPVLQDGKSADSAVYIVQLEGEPLARYRGGIAGLDATSPAAVGTPKLDLRSPASVAYRAHLARQRFQITNEINRTIGRSPKQIYAYDVAFNGMALVLSAQEAAQIQQIAGVRAVKKDAWRYKTTSVSPSFIGADQIWSGTATNGLPATKGEGVIVGIIDSGIWPEHPSFADDGSYPARPAAWDSSRCTPPADGSPSYTCNNKLIGIQFFLSGYVNAVGGTYNGLFLSGRDDDGHGTHTASTAAGNEGVTATLFGVDYGQISGIAPRSYVASYKALGPWGGVTSDLVAAIDKAVADGVDVINYSIGSDSPGDPWFDGDSLAFLAARDAGVFVAVSAGNAGPGDNTIGSPANSPWVTTVAASTSNRYFTSEITLTGDISPSLNMWGTTVTDGITNFRLVDSEGIEDSEGDDSGLCLNPFDPGTFEATDVVLCARGVNGRLDKGDNVKAGGAGAMILYNPVQQDLNTDNFSLPAVHVQNNFGEQIKDYISANTTITVTFTAGQPTFAPDPRVIPDQVAAFSSRGPNGESFTQSILKPDVSAPGVQILAGASPQHTASGAQGELFQSIQGTSMSSPHVAGAGALLKALHPDWTPAEMQSALMLTSVRTMVDSDGTSPADPFDVGAGRIDLSSVAYAGFVLDETTENYLETDPYFDGDPSTLNIPSLASNACVVTCTWTRTIRSTADSAVTWTSSQTSTSGTIMSVSPSSFTLAPGATQTLTFTANVSGQALGDWVFGEVIFTPDDSSVEEAHMPFAVQPAPSTLPERVRFTALSNTGTYSVTNVRALEISSLNTRVYGLTEAQIYNFSLLSDSENDSPFDDLTDGVAYYTSTVQANTARFVAEVTKSTAPDLDMYVGKDDGDGIPEPGELVCISASASALEYCSLDQPSAGVYWVLIQNWAGSAAQPDSVSLAIAAVPGTPSTNLTVTGPNSVPSGQPFTLALNWNTNGMRPESRWYGVFDVGTAAAQAGNLGRVNVDVIGPPYGRYLSVILSNSK